MPNYSKKQTKKTQIKHYVEECKIICLKDMHYFEICTDNSNDQIELHKHDQIVSNKAQNVIKYLDGKRLFSNDRKKVNSGHFLDQ